MTVLSKNLLLGFLIFFTSGVYSNSSITDVNVNTSPSNKIHTKPKLVVGIVVDQMRYDYLPMFWDKYSNKGFKRLIRKGFLFKNAHYNYMPTYTAPGHASIYTGSTPRFHGIIANDWYDKITGEFIYCAEDDSVLPVGTEVNKGRMSPKQLLSTTVCDQNRLATQFQGKTIGIALKDRAAIMPAGRSANAAYWFYGKDEGKFITSSYYMDSLPNWVNNFNNSNIADTYLKVWEPLYPISTYTESGPDLNDYEGIFEGKETATFPYDLKKLSQEKYGYDILLRTVFGNNITTDFALAAIEGENLGQDNHTDFLTISYSSPDYIGHTFGVNSKEIQDNYLRLDLEIARLLEELDKKVGKNNYVVFLTADHAAGHVPAYLKSKKMAAGYYSYYNLKDSIKQFVKDKFGTDTLIANISNYQVFFNSKEIANHKVDRRELSIAIQQYLIDYPNIAQVYSREILEGSDFTGIISQRVKNGYHPKRSGDIVFVLEPETISDYYKTGTTHGSPYSYDTHVPIIFYGKGIKKGQTTKAIEIVDIAPTLSALLGIGFPNTTTGRVLHEVID